MQRGTPSPPPPLKKRKISSNQADHKLIGLALPRQPILPNNFQLHDKPKSLEPVVPKTSAATQKAPEQPHVISSLQSNRIFRNQQSNSTTRLQSAILNAQDIFNLSRSTNFNMPAFTPSAMDLPQMQSLERLALALGDPLLPKMIHSSLMPPNFFNVSSNGLSSIPHSEQESKVNTALPVGQTSGRITPLNQISRSVPVTPPHQVPICLPVGCAPPSIMINQNSKSSSKKTKKSEVPKVKICRMDSCNEAAARRTPYCSKHSGPRRCEKGGCNKCAQGRTRFCIAHGGGRRCTVEGCTKGARDRFFCAAHGGGRRCTMAKCSKLAVDTQGLCTAHGGGRRCEIEGCPKSAQSNTNLCVRHGGGRKCSIDGCSKVARGKSGCCMLHSRMSG